MPTALPEFLQAARHGCPHRNSLSNFAPRQACVRQRRSRHVQSSLEFAGSPDVHQTVAAKLRRRVAIFVEPSPFSHVSGMKNRFECLIQGLRGKRMLCVEPIARTSISRIPTPAELGDDVTVVTPDVNPPKHYFGARVRIVALYVSLSMKLTLVCPGLHGMTLPLLTLNHEHLCTGCR